MEDITRAGTFSSSQMWKLMTNNRKGDGFGAPGLTYIKQVKYESRLKRPMNKEFNSKPTSWGTLTEQRVYNILPLEYSLVSKDRLVHPRYEFWTGMPDLKRDNVVSDVKCPFSLEVFCDKVAALGILELYKEEFPEDYWQHVSSSILTGLPKAEAIIYCPTQAELSEIRKLATNYDGFDQWKFKWIDTAEDSELPYIIEGGFYKNLNQFEFEVPEADKALLTERVIQASKLLIQI